MKKYSLMMFAAVLAVASCSEKLQTDDTSQGVEVKEISTVLYRDTDVDVNPVTRSLSATLADPSTTPISVRGGLGWNLDVQIYNGATPYALGANTYVWSAGNSWISQAGQSTYFPNYWSQNITFSMHPVPAVTTIALNQSDANQMLLQDKLYVKSYLSPSHILNATLLHAQSMLDFTFDKIPTNIASVTVQVGSDIYTPYLVPGGGSHYLLILPSGVSIPNPVVIVQTAKGAIYKQTVNVGANPSALGVNYRYVFKLYGFNLVLSPITIVDWVTGRMVDGNYVAEVAYPTFRGPAGTSCTLTFDNHLTQVITFNSQGEYTVKAAGRTIKQVSTTNGSVSCSIILGTMIIDLNATIASITVT